MTTLTDAQRLLREGRIAEAERACAAVLEHSPDDVEALNVVALAAVRDGAPAKAVALLERATRNDPASAASFHHLGRAHESLGDLSSALASFAQALRLEPGFYHSRLRYASLLERSGEVERGTMQYARALRDAQSRGQWTNPSSTPANLRPLVEHAVRTFKARRRGMLFAITEKLAQRYGQRSMTRVEKCLRVYLGEQPANRPDPRQQPSFLYFPDLPASAYLDPSILRCIAPLEAETRAIREELLRVLSSELGRERVFAAEETERQNLRSTTGTPSWNGYYFYRHGARRDENCAVCPTTAAALDRLPLARVREHAPEALFSVFTAGTHLLPHRGVTNTRLVAHLPLIVPVDCALKVGGELHIWQEGKVVVFDDTYEHEAWNRSQETRVVLIFDLWNPHLAEAERAAITEVVAAIGDLREAIDRQ
jgi:aspartate beta-hydroxylase